MLTRRHLLCLGLSTPPLPQELQVCRGGRLERVAGSVRPSDKTAFARQFGIRNEPVGQCKRHTHLKDWASQHCNMGL